MNCRGVSRRLSAFIDDELSPGIRNSLEEHLRLCAACARKYSELKAISDAARALPPMIVSEGFKERVLESARAGREEGAAYDGFRMRLVISGLAFVAAATAVFFLVGPSSVDIVTTETPAPAFSSGAQEPGDTVDFTEDPTIKIKSFHVPQGSWAEEMVNRDSSVLIDSSRMEEFIMPEIERTKENVNIEF